MAQAQEKINNPKVIDLKEARAKKRFETPEKNIEVATLYFNKNELARMIWDGENEVMVEYVENGNVKKSDSWSLDEAVKIFSGSPLFDRALNVPLFKNAVEKASESKKRELG